MKRLFFLLILVLFVVGCQDDGVDDSMYDGPVVVEKMMKENVYIDDKKLEIDDSMKAILGSTEYDYVATLKNVAGGDSSGVAKAVYSKGKYLLKVDLTFLPDTEEGYFYEGWLVRKGLKFNVISTGKAEKLERVYTNNYVSEKDLTDHLFYVLTLEPDDGDPAPAEHILEGSLEEIIK